jgi:hypothetical protein
MRVLVGQAYGALALAVALLSLVYLLSVTPLQYWLFTPALQ